MSRENEAILFLAGVILLVFMATLLIQIVKTRMEDYKQVNKLNV